MRVRIAFMAAGVACVACGLRAGPAGAQTWTISTIDATGTVGLYTDLQVDAAGDLHVVYYRSDDHSLKTMSRISGTWTSPEVIDNAEGTGRGTLARGPANLRRVAYRNTDSGAQAYAGPEIPRAWSKQAVVQTGDVGRNLKTLVMAGGEIGVSYRNATAGSLQLVRLAGGSWTSPVAVDPGPNRGADADIGYRPGDGYVFSEYDPANGSALLADPTLHGRPWSVGTALASADDVGRSLSLLQEADGNIVAAFRNLTQGSLQYIRRTGATWSGPVTVDPGPGRGQHFDVAARTGIGYAFSEYDPANGAVLLADPALHARTWNFGPVEAGEDDVGRGLSLLVTGGAIGAAYRDETVGSLRHARFESGAWTAPVTVDPGPQRGGSCDIGFQSGVGYCFSERDAVQGSAVMAHPGIAATRWNRFAVDARLDTGSQLATSVGPLGRIECAYVAKDASGKLELRSAEIVPGTGYTTRFVADSVSMIGTGHVRPDVFVRAGEDWAISFRKTGPQDLYMATTDDWQLMPAEAPDAGDDPGFTGPVPITTLHAAYPNPSEAAVRIRFTSAAATDGEFRLYDAAGRLVRHADLDCRRGENTVTIDRRTDGGAALAPGVYFARLRVGNRVLGPRKLVLIGSERGNR